MSIGKLKNDHLQCPFHGFEYDGGGRCVHIPANGKGGHIPASLRLRSYPAYEDHDFIWIWWGDTPPKDLPAPVFFDNLGDGFFYGSKPDHWKAHYSRVIENQLDVVHLPFVHHNTIGRGDNTVVDGPVVRWENDTKMLVYVYNRPDDGTPPRKSNELSPKEASSVHLELTLPNLWQNFISKDARILAAFTPVDHENTILYLRFYQRFLRIPVLGKLIAELAMPYNIHIAHQDRRVVMSHRSQVSSMALGEKLIQGDLPIIQYRRKREELQHLASLQEVSS